MKHYARGNFLFFLLLTLIVFLGITHPAFAQKPDILEVMTIAGEIDSGTAAQINTQVDAINENPKIRAVLLVLDTPGGGVSPSAAIYEDLSRLKVPVVAWCQSMCASGGVYVSMAPTVKYIAVREQTIGGSVGVVMHMMKYNRLLDWAKIDPKTYRSGILKDSGNPTRPMEEAEDKYLQGIVTSLAGRFYDIVGKQRKIADWDELKTAKIFIGKDIVRIGLADGVMTRAQVEAKAKELSGSKTIFTRDELKKMSAAADPAAYHSTAPSISMIDRLMGDAHYLVDVFREIHGGEAVTFSYRLPISF